MPPLGLVRSPLKVPTWSVPPVHWNCPPTPVKFIAEVLNSPPSRLTWPAGNILVCCAMLTVPPAPIVSEPVPPLVPVLMFPPTERLVMVQLDPAPVTVAIPFEPTSTPTPPSNGVETWPPSSMESVPLPLRPTLRLFMLIQLDPAPLTATSPIDPAFTPMVPKKAFETWPPACIASEPSPDTPTRRLSPQVQVEPSPWMVAMPRESENSPRSATLLATAPPS